MSYADQQALSVDGEFLGRQWAALCAEAAAKPPEDATAAYILRDPWAGVQLFVPFVAVAPGFGDKYAQGGQEAITDNELLSAVQAAWPRVRVPSE